MDLCQIGDRCGAVAQLGERRVRNAKVGSSILLGSTNLIPATLQARITNTRESPAWELALPELRVDLINAQYELQSAGFPVLVLIGADDRLAADDLIDTLNEWMDARYIDTRWFGPRRPEERAYPPFWRYWRELPASGRIGLFASAWATHPVSERVFGQLSAADFQRRLEHIRQLEKALVEDGTLLLKFWLHLPADEQRRRARAAHKHKDKYWKFDEEDRRAYQVLDRALPLCRQLIEATDTEDCPWQLVTTSDRRQANFSIASALLASLRQRLGRTPEETIAPPAQPTIPSAGKSPLDSVNLTARLDYAAYKSKLLKQQRKIRRRSAKAARRGLSSVLVFEGWDAAGKGGAIRRLTRAMSARHYRVIPISAPSDEELAHHYLWRFWRRLPRAGGLVIFDRSWYGRVLVERVEGLASEAAWRRAYQEINDFEAQLVESGINLQKFWLHLDADEQLRRFQAREQTPYKKYKITTEDYRNRSKREQYVHAINDMIAQTSTPATPWHLIPANDKRWARVRIAREVSRGLKRQLS